MEKGTTVKGGMSFLEALQILLIALKLLNKIDWAWKWVLAPTWISLIVFIIVLIAVFIVHKY